MMCDCIDKLNKSLEERGENTRIAASPLLNFKTGSLRMSGAAIVTKKADTQKRGKPKVLFASYCPFCGKRYETDEVAPEEDK